MQEQLNRIEAMLIQLLERKKPKQSLLNEWIPPVFVDSNIWDDFIAHRKEKGHAMKETTYKRMLKKMNQWHKDKMDVDGILLASIENGWIGLFEPRNLAKESQQHVQTNSASYKKYDPAAKVEVAAGVDPWAELRGEG